MTVHSGSYKLSKRSLSVHTLLLWISISLYQTNTIIADGQEIIPFIPGGNDPIFRLFLESCETITVESQCTEEEYENNEDCLPQETDTCDRSKELFCLSGVCLPNCHPHKESYDYVEGKCFRKVGNDCRSQNAAATTTNTISQTSSSSRTTADISNSPGGVLQQSQDTQTDNGLLASEQEHHSRVNIIPECEKNAICERGQCRCVRNYTYDHNLSKCILYASYAQYCNDTVNCDRKSDIVCSENQCQCMSQETQYFHLKRKRCYILIGQVCSNGLQFCPDNSNCVREKGNRSGSSLPTTLQSGHSRISNSTRDRLLLHQRLFIKGTDDDDNDGDSNDDVGEDEHFIGILGESEEGKAFVCKCDKGYGYTRDQRFCLALHQTRCNTLHRCNTERGLKCIQGICLCEREQEGEQVYSETFQSCITTIGSPCSADGKGEREEDICPIGASCTGGEDRKCACEPGLTPSLSRHSTTTTISAVYACMKGHGMSCKNNNTGSHSPEGDPFEPPCNLEIGLECSIKEEKCLCKDSNQFYDATRGKCENFQTVVDRKIPVIHFTPPEDREYAFRKNHGSMNKLAKSILYTLTIYSALYSFVFLL